MSSEEDRATVSGNTYRVKFGVWFLKYASGQTNNQRDTPDTLITILRTSIWIKVNIAWWQNRVTFVIIAVKMSWGIFTMGVYTIPWKQNWKFVYICPAPAISKWRYLVRLNGLWSASDESWRRDRTKLSPTVCGRRCLVATRTVTSERRRPPANNQCWMIKLDRCRPDWLLLASWFQCLLLCEQQRSTAQSV